LYRYW